MLDGFYDLTIQNMFILLIKPTAKDEKWVFESCSAAIVAVPAPEHKQLASFLNYTVGLFNKHRFQCRAASMGRILKLLCGERKERTKMWSVIISLQSARSHTHTHTPIGIWQGYYSGAVGDGRKIKFWWGHCIISLWVRSVFSVWLLRDDSPLNAWGFKGLNWQLRQWFQQ